MRRPARLERAGPLTPRDRIWSAIRALQEFSVADVMHLSEVRDDTALSYLRALERAQYVEAAPSSHYAARRREFRRYRLVRDVGAHAPRVTADGEPVRQGRGREAMWNYMRRAREDFSWRDVAYFASTPETRIAPDEAQYYCRALERAGYLRIVSPSRGGRNGTPVRYRFAAGRDTGPRAPIVTRAKEVMDANTGEIHAAR